MSKLSTIQWLSNAVSQATMSAKFCVAGCLPVADPGIEVEGLGAVKVPLKRTKPKDLIARCRVAPYGKGTQTLVDRNVRNTFELDPKKFRLSGEWNAVIADATQLVSQQLGLPAEQLEAKLYKLLVYQRGGFFLPHRDSEKHDRMVASLIVVLPNRFEGGRLVVRHGAVKQTFLFDEAAKGEAACYAAFYADCEHEVEQVASGIRLCLAYNLVLKPKRKARAAAKSTAAADVLAESIRTWGTRQPAKPLVFALEHHYTQHGLSLDLLKGADRQLADVVVAIAEKANCHVHLAQVSRHLCQFADDGSFARSYSRRWTPRHEIEIGETYEDDLRGTAWTDLHGKKQPWGEIAFDLAFVVSSQ